MAGCQNEYSPINLEVDKKSNYKSFEEFQAKIFGNQINYSNCVLSYRSIYDDAYTFYVDYSQSPKINGTSVNYAPSKTYDSPFLKAVWNSGIVQIQKGIRSLVLDFTSNVQ